jgi:release factor glutamine methyltransferase
MVEIHEPQPDDEQPAAPSPPLTVGAAIVQGETELRAAGIETADVEIRLLLAHVLRIPHLEVGLERGRALSPSEARVFVDLLAARARRLPVQHLLGDVEFYGRVFRIGPGVLVPRPETESVAETALQTLSPTADYTVAEVGCGAGILSVTIACERPRCTIWCADVAPAAVSLTELNAAAHGVGDRVHARLGDLFTPLRAAAPFQLVVANPPYIPTAEIDRLAPEVRDHDPRAALDGGPDGLALIRRLLADAGGVLAGGGTIVLEMGYDQGQAVAELAREHGWREVTILPDLAGRERVLQARWAAAARRSD